MAFFSSTSSNSGAGKTTGDSKNGGGVGGGLQDQVLKALGTVQDPDLKKDIVTLNMVKGLEVDERAGTVQFEVVLTTPACPLKEKIKSDCEAAVRAVPGVSQVSVKMSAQVKNNAKVTGTQSIPGVSHVIAVSSGKGGVGKSTVAVNLAIALQREGARVGLMDADIYGPNTPTMMGLTERPDMKQDPVRGEIFVPPRAHGMPIMSMGFLIQADQPMIWRGPMLHSVVSQFCHKVDWGTLDYLIVDMPPGTGDVQLSLAQLTPVTGAVLVTTPQEVSLQDVRKAFHMFNKIRVPILGIVENMSYFECGKCSEQHHLFGQGGGAKLAAKQGVDLLAEFPLVPAVQRGGDEGQPIALGESETAARFRSLAQKVAQKISILTAAGLADGPQVEIGRF